MIASSVFVLTALTMTGVYVKSNSEKSRNDGYHIDFSVLEEDMENHSVSDKYEEIQNQAEGNLSRITEDDLDYTPMEQVDSGVVEIPGLTNKTTEGTIGTSDVNGTVNIPTGINHQSEQNGDTEEEEEAKDRAAMEADAVSAGAGENKVTQPSPNFQAGDRLLWPVFGDVLIPYSMDKTVYFSTLQQYKYNPAVIISAEEGTAVSASAAGQVTNVFSNEEIGNAITVNVGNGYEITYGQLKDITVSKGSYLEKGTILGYVAAPTKYYSVEGSNVYFAFTLNGTPVNPMEHFQ